MPPKKTSKPSKTERSAISEGDTIWARCSVCAEQMVGGPRCYEHNPTPEMRVEREAAGILAPRFRFGSAGGTSGRARNPWIGGGRYGGTSAETSELEDPLD